MLKEKHIGKNNVFSNVCIRSKGYDEKEHIWIDM